MNVLTPVLALEALGLTTTVEDATGALGQAQKQARAFRDGTLVAVTMRNTEDEAIDALFRNVTQPARRTQRRGKRTDGARR